MAKSVEELRAYQLKYKAENREKIKSRRHSYYLANKKVCQDAAKLHAIERSTYLKEYAKANKENLKIKKRA